MTQPVDEQSDHPLGVASAVPGCGHTAALLILARGIERKVLPVAKRYGMGTIVWSPLAQGTLTGRIRKGQQTTCAEPAVSVTSATNGASMSWRN